MFKQLHINITLVDALILISKYQKLFKALLSNKEKLLELANTPLNENCSVVILKVLPEKLEDPRKFLILCGFSELECKALADLGASINLMPLSVWKKLVSKFTFPADFVIVDYESDPRVPLILGRPFLRTACALIDVHGEEMILRDGDERLTLNMRQVKDDVFDPEGGNVLAKKLLDLDSTKDLHPPHNVNPLSDSTTSSSPNHLLKEFADELALITFLPGNDDLPFDIESNYKKREYLLNNDPIKDIDSILKDSTDEGNIVDLYDNLADSMPEMFTNKHALDYSSPSLYDEYDDDLFKVDSDTEYVYDDPFESKGKKIKESKLLTDELDLPSDFLPSSEYDSFLFEDFSEVYALPSTNNEDKDFDPSFYELLSFKEVPDKMANENVPVPTPIRYDDQILPFAAWVPIGKRNFVLDLNKKQKNPTGAYSFQLDETRFVLDANILRDALEIIHANQAQQFVSPPLGDAIMDFVNQLGYTEIIYFVSRMAVNNLYQPWRAILSMINQRNLYKLFRPFSMIRSASPFYLAEEDFRLGNLKFVPKGKIDEVFGMPIPNELISNNIRNAPYYNAYLEMVAKHDQKVAAKKEGKKKTASAKQSNSKPAVEKLSKPAPAPKPKPTKERPFKASTAKPPKLKPEKEKSTKTTLPEQAGKGKIVKVRKAKSPFQLVDEPDEEPAHSEPEPKLEHQGEGDEDDMEQATRPLPVVEAKTNSGGNTKILHFEEEQGKDVDDQVNLEEETNELDQGQAGSDPGRTLVSRTSPKQVVMDKDQTRSDPG
nr:reverse transcriptase domain-containing protein [Tanacetum cinerariifolium]